MNPRFFLSRRYSGAEARTKQTDILLVIRGVDQRGMLKEYRIFTGLKTTCSAWVSSGQRHLNADRVRWSAPNAKSINKRLDEISHEVHRLLDEAYIKGVDPIAHVKDGIRETSVLQNYRTRAQRHVSRSNSQQQESFGIIEQFEAFLREREESHMFRKSTLGANRVIFKNVKAMVEWEGKTLNVPDISKAWSHSFRKFLFQERGLTNNTVHKTLSFFSTFILWCGEKGICDGVRLRKLIDKHGLESKAQTIALTAEEVTAVENLDLGHKTPLSIAREIFLLSIYTALRASDLRDLNPSHIVNNTIEKRSIKTKNELRIPLKAPAYRILERYGFKLPMIADQKLNENIKHVCALAGMDRQ